MKGGLYFINQMKSGRTVAIIPSDTMQDYDVAIFYLKNKKIYSYGANIGTLERSDMTLNDLLIHFDNMINEGSSLFARGIID